MQVKPIWNLSKAPSTNSTGSLIGLKLSSASSVPLWRKSKVITWLEDDGNVRRVEQLDWVGGVLAAVASGLDWKVNTESLERNV